MIPTSPEAAMLGRFGDIPIGHYTGTADISIPLYTLKEGGLEIPIKLRYHGSGIKVEDDASNVGLGWSLEPGGSILQIINGTPDGANGDLLYQRNPSGYDYLLNQGGTSFYYQRYEKDLLPCHSFDSGDSYSTFVALQQGDGQPDLYQYSFGKYSGKFSINPVTGKIVLLNKKDDIEFTGGAGGWIAKTMDGDKYYFLATETSKSAGSQYFSGITAKLTKIELANGKVISFDYADGYYQWNNYSETFHSEYPLVQNNNNNILVKNTLTDDHHVKTLTRITTDEVIIDFNLGDRIDMYTANSDGIAGVKRISSVDIKDAATGLKKKSFNLNYDYFTANAVGGDYLYPLTNYLTAATKRLKLLSVQEVGYNLASQPVLKPAYKFTYEEAIQLPMKTSFARDFWGYYNGQNNSKMIPNLSFYYYSGDNDYSNIPSALIDMVDGANRSPDSTKMQAGMLKRVTYPTGGFTVFDYEQHKFGNYIYPDINQIKNSTLSGNSQDTNNSADPATFTFTLPHSQSITFHTSITKGPNPDVTFYQLQPSYVTLSKTVNGVTTLIRKWQGFAPGQVDQFNSTGGYEWNDSITLDEVDGAVYTVYSYLEDALGQQNIFPKYASAGCHFVYEGPIEQNAQKSSYGGGLRIKSVSNYLATGELSGKKIFKYVYSDNTSSGKLMSPLKTLFSRSMTGAVFYPNQNGTGILRMASAPVWFVSSESVVPFSTSADGGVVGYTRVEENDVLQDGTINGRHIYNYHNFESQAHAHVPDNPDLQNGLIQKEEVYNNSSEVPLLETNYTYADKESSYFNGIQIASVYIGDSPCNSGDATLFDWNSIHQWEVNIYPIYSHWYVLQNKVTTESFDGTLVSTFENFDYNSKGQLITTNKTDSKGRIQSTEFLYPIDNSDDPMSATLIDHGLYNSLQSQSDKINGYTMSKVQAGYRLENDQVVQKDIVRTNGAYNPYTDITFDKYGPNKTLEQFTQNGPPTSILWSFSHTRPIAVVKNTNFSTLQTLLGDDAISSFSAKLNPSKTEIDSFLSPLSGLFVLKYSYDAANGITSQTDPKGQVTSYEYDDFQRLLNIKDQNGYILKNFQYHFADPGSTTTQVSH